MSVHWKINLTMSLWMMFLWNHQLESFFYPKFWTIYRLYLDFWPFHIKLNGLYIWRNFLKLLEVCILSQVACDILKWLALFAVGLCYIHIFFDNALYAADSMAWRIVTYVSVSVAIPTLMAVRNIKHCLALWLMLLERYTILFVVVTSIIVMGSLSVTMKRKRFHP